MSLCVYVALCAHVCTCACSIICASSIMYVCGSVGKMGKIVSNVIHNLYASSDGMGRTGTFICIDSELERLKSEGFIDIFQCVKSSRCCRPHLVENVVRRPTSCLYRAVSQIYLSCNFCQVQYAYCHEILAGYLESMDTYSNF